MIGRSVAGVGALLFLVVLAGCGTGSERVIEPGELARGVEAALAEAGATHDEVSCEESVLAQVAESTECTMSVGGKRYAVTVVITDIRGDQAIYDVDVAPELLP